MLTLEEIKERLKASCDELTIIEVLNISMDELLDRFEDKLEDKLDELNIEFEEDYES